MFCPNCGKQNPEEDRFCFACGSQLIDNQPDEPVIVNDAAEAADSALNFLWKYRKGIVIGLCVFVGVILLFYTVRAVIGHFVGADQLVESYVEAMIEEDWEDMYDCLALPEGELLTEEAFCTYMENNHTESHSEIVRYEIRERSSGYEESSGLIKQYDVVYVGIGSSSEQSFSITLVRQPKNKLLFFPDYKVSTDQMLCSAALQTRPGAVVTLDGNAVTEGTENEYGEWIAALPQMFAGQHTLRIEYPNCEPVEEIISIQNGQQLYYMDFHLDEATVQQLENMTKELAQVLYPAVGSNTPLDAVTLPCPFTEDSYQRLKESYNYMLDSFHGYSSMQTTGITVTNQVISSDTSNRIYDADGVYFEVETDYSYTQIYRSNSNVYTGYGYLGVYYQLIDGTWTVSYVANFNS